MPHLGADVAAYVDGQLSDAAMRAASTHLETCDTCERAVRQQRLLKSRMRTVAAPEPPAGLLQSLTGLAAVPPPQETWWQRLLASTPLRAGVVVAGAATVVVVAAYALGGSARLGDEVAPPYDGYAAAFYGSSTTTGTVPAGNVISETTMAELDGAGWPCRATLAGNLRRVAGRFSGSDEVVALTYTDGRSRLHLFEQNGALDHEALEGFATQRLGDAEVWVRPGDPMVLTWDDEGVVYTIVTDVERDRVVRAVADLPRRQHDEGLMERVGAGLARMSWGSAA